MTRPHRAVKRRKPAKPKPAPGPRVASGIPVYCSHTAIVRTAELVPNPRNPNRHPDAQVALLAKIISAQGWRNPIVVSDRSGFVVKGHCRRLAAQRLGVETVPVDVQHYADEAGEWADMVADNRVAELAEMDMGGLKDLLQEMDTGGYDMELTGYDEAALEEMMTALPPDGLSVEPATDSQAERCTCPECGQVHALKGTP